MVAVRGSVELGGRSVEWQVKIRLPFDAAKEDAYIVFCKRMVERVRDWEALWPIWVHDGQKWWQEISMSGFLELDAEDNEEGAHAALTQLTKDKIAVDRQGVIPWPPTSFHAHARR